MRKFIGQVKRVHILIGGNEHLFSAGLLHKGKIAAPFVFHPNGIEIFRLCAEHHHDLGAVERCENIRLIGAAELILQSNPREKDLEPLLRQLVIEVICKHTVLCASAVCVRFLIADKDIKRLLLAGNFKNALLNFINYLRLRFIDCPLRIVGMGNGGFIICVGENRGILRAVHRGDAFMCCRILHIFDTVAAKHKRPIRLGIVRILAENLLVNAHGLVEIVVAAEMIRTVIQVGALIIIQARQGLLRAAAVADADACAWLEFNRAAAHFTFKCCHF